METKLNSLLASIHTLNNKLHNVHWFMKGNMFLSVHEKTEEQYNELFTLTDDLAELMLQKDLKPKFTNKYITSFSLINDDFEYTDLLQEDMIKLIVSDFEFLINYTKELQDDSDDENIKDFLLGFNNYLLKQRWLLKSLI